MSTFAKPLQRLPWDAPLLPGQGRHWGANASSITKPSPTSSQTVSFCPAPLISLAAQLTTRQKAHAKVSGDLLELEFSFFREGECVQRGQVLESTQSVSDSCLELIRKLRIALSYQISQISSLLSVNLKIKMMRRIQLGVKIDHNYRR